MMPIFPKGPTSLHEARPKPLEPIIFIMWYFISSHAWPKLMCSNGKDRKLGLVYCMIYFKSTFNKSYNKKLSELGWGRYLWVLGWTKVFFFFFWEGEAICPHTYPSSFLIKNENVFLFGKLIKVECFSLLGNSLSANWPIVVSLRLVALVICLST